MMSVKTLLFVFGVLYIGVDSRLISPPTSFNKELTFFDKRITLSSSYNVVTENDSFVYAVCDSQEKTFKENKCNVTIETPAFNNATYREMCAVRLAPNNRNYEVLTKMRLYDFDEDKVLLSWLIKDADFRTKVVRIRILSWLNCEFLDVSVPADMIYNIITYDNTFDVVISNRTLCSSDYCRITYDVSGKKISGPFPLPSNIKIASLEGVIPVSPRSSARGFYLLARIGKNSDEFHVLHVDHDGKGTELMKTQSNGNIKMSNSHDSLSVCWIKQTSNITCWQYHGKVNTKMETIKFFDNSEIGFTRWVHPHNLANHELLVVSGRVNLHNQPRFESFSITKIHADGRHERQLEIRGLDYRCSAIEQFFVHVTETDEDEICFHFICDRPDFDKHGIRNTLKFSTKCLPKKHLTMIKRKGLKSN